MREAPNCARYRDGVIVHKPQADTSHPAPLSGFLSPNRDVAATRRRCQGKALGSADCRRGRRVGQDATAQMGYSTMSACIGPAVGTPTTKAAPAGVVAGHVFFKVPIYRRRLRAHGTLSGGGGAPPPRVPSPECR